MLFRDSKCLQIPLCFVKEVKKTGVAFTTEGVGLVMDGRRVNPSYEVDYYQNVLKKSELPAILQLPDQLALRFHDKTRDNFFDII